MFRKAISLLSLLILWQISVAQNSHKPKLIVGVVVDQMRQEYMHRFAGHYGDGGFKRLLNEGFELKNGHFNYVPTYTGPGHASVYSGTTPRVHGIISNQWYNKRSKKMMYCAEDSSVSAVGGSEDAGQMSPKNLLTTTITDELMLFYQNRSKVVGVSIKDRGSILPAGHQPTGAYWYDSGKGEFMTSTFYTESLKPWVKKHNKQKWPEKLLKDGWNTILPIGSYVESARDDRPYETAWIAEKPIFPYDFTDKTKEEQWKIISGTPMGNTMILEMGLAAIAGEQLGQDDIPDFLAISFSSTDYIGHAYGPYSKEIQDTYIRLDKDLERMMNYLDEKVGEGEWTLFLTADHAVADIPAYLKEHGHSVDYTDPKLKDKILTALENRFGDNTLIENVSSSQVFLNHQKIKELKLEKSVVANFIADQMNNLYGIGTAYTADQINAYAGSNYEVKLLAAGYNAYRSGDVLFTINPGWLTSGNANGGTTHGSHYSYDTHVPIIFYGKGVKKGSSVTYHAVTDIAPTLSMMLNIKLPSGATGQPVVELLED